MLAGKIGHFRAKDFDPRSISGLAAWYDSDAASSYSSSGGQVSSWSDKSGTITPPLTQATAANRPTLFTSSADTQTATPSLIGSRQGLFFDGTNDRIEAAITARPITGSAAFTMFSVAARESGDTTYGRTIFHYGPWTPTDSASISVADIYTGGQQRIAVQSGYGNAIAPSSIHSGATVYRIHRDAGGPILLYTNRAQMHRTSTIGTNIDSAGGAFSIRVGYFNINNSVNSSFRGRIGEVLVYSRRLTQAEIDSVESYLAAKWGVSATLPPRVSNADAQDWIDRVYGSGGTVSTATANAVNTFCNAIDAAGIRDRFMRLNLFAGTGLAAALVPLYRGQSLGGTQFGNSTDTNTNFASTDYSETTGLLNATGTKFLSTGVTSSQLPASSGHVAWSYTNNSFSASGFAWGVSHQATHRTYAFISAANSQSISVASSAFNEVFSAASAYGRWLASRTSLSLLTAYRNGASVGSNTSTVAATTGSTDQFLVFRSAVGSGSRFGMNYYGFGESMTAAQAASFDSAVSAFLTALGRS
jgi:hypothetical protein